MAKPEVTYRLECLTEHEPIEGNALASGDDAADRECEQWIRDELNRGNEWAWCCVKVTASVELDGETFEAFDTLGCCSYKSEQDFRACQYFADMQTEAHCQLLDALRLAHARGEISKRLLDSLQD